LNFSDTVFIGDPSIQHHVVTRSKLCIQEQARMLSRLSVMSGAHFIDEQEEVQYFLLAKVSIVGGNEWRRVNTALGCIGKVLCAGGSCHRQFTIFVVLVLVEI
jgi:hypothetical protein